jgi:hypothetical protein
MKCGHRGSRTYEFWVRGHLGETTLSAFPELQARVQEHGTVSRGTWSGAPIRFFGVLASPLPGPWNWQPAAFRVVGPFGPFGAATNGAINGVFFPGGRQTGRYRHGRGGGGLLNPGATT